MYALKESYVQVLVVISMEITKIPTFININLFFSWTIPVIFPYSCI